MTEAQKHHTLFDSLKRLEGNARGCVMTEPIWGIAYNLYIPYVSVYMLALGLVDEQIGLIATIGQILQVITALFGGVIADKFGRRRTTLVFELLSWTLPALISAVAQNFWYFLLAAVVNSVWRIVHNSWSCLLVEDTDPDQLVDIYSWIYIAGLMVAFFSPIASWLIKQYDLVPTMRGIYYFAAVMFTVKAFATYFSTKETEQGKKRMEETRHQSIFAEVMGLKDVLKKVLQAPRTLITVGIMAVMSAVTLITMSFSSVLLTERLQLPAESLAIFQVVRSIIRLLVYLFLLPRIRNRSFKQPMLFGFGGLILAQVLIISAPIEGYAFVTLSTILEAACFATVGPLLDQMLVLTVEAQERARIQSLMFVAVILLTSPFGYIGGLLSAQNKALPFMLNIVLYGLGIVLVSLAARAVKDEELKAVAVPAE